ncbi:hypothetical protein [Thermococcus aciditolerans]|nr:hypothetical protein [Thermococcus aciditolerans]
MDRNILIIIPAYNEELTVGSVVALAKKYGDVLKRSRGGGVGEN